MEVWMLIAALAVAYAGGAYSWPLVRTKWRGALFEAQQLKLRAIKLENQIRGKL